MASGSGRARDCHLHTIYGDPPPEMELEIVWEDHDLGGYPPIATISFVGRGQFEILACDTR
jgi:hypothetical protein